jgi:hypothetical protein
VRFREVLDERAHRPAQPRCQGRVLRGLRRPERAARGGQQHLAPRHRADLHYSSDPQHVSAHLRKYWDEIKRDIKPIYTAVNATAARSAFDELTQKWGQRYPAVIRLWDHAWAEFIPFLDYDVEIRRVIGVRRRRLLIRAMESDIRAIDRMLHALANRLSASSNPLRHSG